MNNGKTSKQLKKSIVLILLLSLCLCFTSAALVYSVVVVEDNVFATGTVKINLNDGKSVIKENEFLFEPGMTVKKEFFIENQSTCDVYYKLYFNNVDGGLADVLQIKICDGQEVLLSGTPKELGRKEVLPTDDVLSLGEKKELQIYFYFPSNIDNGSQNSHLSFDLSADAVQTKNYVG